MSRVFLAAEARLGRQVVVKVLPPEMGAGVNAERFEREIKLAARLQHPHIVPVLAAGAQGDLLYYVMPYIAGESLRAKLAREGELPILEAVRILREVVDALAYAHRNGVVHRDIKPDNVLLSEGHAVVTDFGVAKAVSASSGGSGSLTSLGVALGTPAYMAPEQAAADPHVDHRADIYAVGVLAYEMLAGRPPFTAPTPQALLAAHITQNPDPLTRYRPTVSPQLSALIMRCLEKRAADRWQTAGELLPPLDAAATPSGALTPTGTQPVISSGTEAALRRSHPGRVIGLFAAASIGVLALVYVLVHRLGLPDWVLYGAVVLLAIGLPIMLATSVHERRRALARTTLVSAPAAESAVTRWFTWRKALIGGGIAFAALTVLAAAYTAMRLLGIGPVGTLLASGVLKEREPIVLADFENHSAADSTLGASLTEAFRVDLAQSPTVRLVDPPAIKDALQRMQRPAAPVLAAALAREVAERLGSKAVVTGQIDPVGGGYVLSASLVAAADGRVLTAVRETAENSGALLGAIDRLSSKLRERIGESLVTIRANQPLEQVTTGSLPALRKYSDALRLEEAGRDEEAIPLLREAVALDSGFAMAWRKLAVVLGNTFMPYTEQATAATQAFTHRDRLPELERSLAVAYYYGLVEYSPEKMQAAYRSALAIDPDNQPALNNLSNELWRTGRYADAESLAVHAIRVGRGPVLVRTAIQAQVAQGHFADAAATLERYRQSSPGSAHVLELGSELAASQANFLRADTLLRQVRQEQRGSVVWQALTTRMTGLMAARLGKLAESKQLLSEFMAMGDARRLPADYYGGAIDLAAQELALRNQPALALQHLSDALARHPLDSMPPTDRPYSDLARISAMAGKLDQAKRYLREQEATVPAGVRASDLNRYLAFGAVAEAEGRPRDALAAYRMFRQEAGCPLCGLDELARLYDKTGQPDSARVAYEQLITLPAPGRLWGDALSRAPALKRLGELYEAKGDRKKAAAYYGQFIELWKDADAELQSGVREVRGRVGRLAQEAGS